MRSYDEYKRLADAEAYAKHKKWLPILGVLLGIIGVAIGVGVSPQSQGLGGFAGLVIGFVVAFVIYRVILHSSSQASADKMYTADWCAEHALTDRGDDYSPPNGPYANSGKRQKSYRAIEGELNGLTTLFYNFSYWTESTDSDGNSTETEHPYKIMRLMGTTLPIDRLSIAKRGFMNRFAAIDKLQGKLTPERPIQLESVEFNKLFDLTIDDHADDIWIRRIFDPATISAAVAGQFEIPDLRYYDGAWWLIEDKHCRARDLDTLLPWQATAATAIAHLARVQNL
ncbi:MAG: hypothetical protein ACPGWS_09355 [Solirubrobacterales bacterium]